MASGATPRNYKARYPPDPHGQEMSENARIWSIYLEEAADFDANMLAEWRDTIDVLLVFVRLAIPFKSFSKSNRTIIGRSLLCCTNNILGTNIAKYATRLQPSIHVPSL